METKYKPNDPQLIENILAEVKRSGMFDQFRKDCISDVDTKPAYQNLQFKVENTVTKFLSSQKWSADTNRNQLREKLRKNILDSGYLDTGIERIVDQVLYPKMAGFQSQIEELVYSYLNIDRPKKKEIKEEPSEAFNSSSLLPKDLESVSSPESDKPKTPKQEESFDKATDDTDDESPAFEPLEGVEQKKETNDDSHLSGLSNMKSECDYEIAADQKDESLKQEDEDESQLSQVSSKSRLSIVIKSETDTLSPKPEVLNITEEAQMPKFSENSNSIDSKGPLKAETAVEGQSVFDFKKEEIEFQGPSRKQMTLDEKLQEEIYESENKHGKLFKPEDVMESNSHSSDMKLEIVEQNITESESGLKIDIDAERSETGDGVNKEETVKEEVVVVPKVTEISENEAKVEEKSEKQSKSTDKSRRSDHKSSKSSKSHSSSHSRKHSSSGHHSSSSKSRYSDRDRHHSSSSSKHKSSSSGKDRDRNSSKDKDKDRHRSRSSHKPSEKRHSDDHKKDSKISDQPEVAPLPPLPPLPPPQMEPSIEKIEAVESLEEKQPPIPDINPPSSSSKTTESDEEDFYGFSEPETGTLAFTTPLSTPAKVIVTPLSQKMNKSFTDEDSFYGFDDATPKKASTSGSSGTSGPPSLKMETPKEFSKQDEDSRSSGKRVRRPNTKYLSEDFTTQNDDDEPELPGKRKKITQDIVKLPKKQKSEEMPELEEEKKANPELDDSKSSKDSKKRSRSRSESRSSSRRR